VAREEASINQVVTITRSGAAAVIAGDIAKTVAAAKEPPNRSNGRT